MTRISCTCGLALYDPRVTRRVTFRSRLLGHVLDDLQAVTPHLIDIGCGTGTFALQLAGARPDARVSAVDGDPKILRRARSKPGANGVDWHAAFADTVPLQDATADRVICSLLLHHLAPATRDATLIEVLRLLRSDGRLHIADWGHPDHLTRIGTWLLQRVDGVTNTRDLIAGRLPYLLSTAGFVDIAVRDRLRTAWGILELISARPK